MPRRFHYIYGQTAKGNTPAVLHNYITPERIGVPEIIVFEFAVFCTADSFSRHEGQLANDPAGGVLEQNLSPGSRSYCF